ncbi:hypothetical protein [Streptomyces virginiae]|uniref:hypothetical protein n=1 Tax=Streptomyces virginiae TaxID=1961 RepID=UPI002250976E|nr:hypothetical protein [Streptomyces virginiae]MCX5174387.1 hypothetical protein [Streptomyces virginiae]
MAGAAQGQVPGRPGVAARGGLLPALVGELLPAPLAHGALRLPLGGTSLCLVRVGAGGPVAVEGVAVGLSSGAVSVCSAVRPRRRHTAAPAPCSWNCSRVVTTTGGVWP